MIGQGWANNCGKELFTLGWVTCTIYVFESEDDETGGKRGYATTGRLNQAQLAQIQREDEELIAIVTVIAKAIL